MTGAADTAREWRRSAPAAFMVPAQIGMLGGMIGLGGARPRLPLLVGLFGFLALQAVILNKAMSLAVVITALPARLVAVPFPALAPHWPVVVNLLSGSLVGAWAGASWATRMRAASLRKVLAALLVLMAAALVWTHFTPATQSIDLPAPVLAVLGLVAGFAIGVVAAVMGVAGGELLIPTIVLSTASTSRSPAALPRSSLPPCWSRSPATAATKPSPSSAATAAS